VPEAADRCADCGTPAGADDAYCRACGAALDVRVQTPR
jgi:predicted amidophosphoribosyltransferase